MNCFFRFRSVVGYVQDIYQPQTFQNSTTKVDFTIQKFVLNNNDGIKIQVNMYDNEIKTFSSKLATNKVQFVKNVCIRDIKMNSNSPILLKMFPNNTNRIGSNCCNLHFCFL